ncbi:MAG: hypothetical protein ACK448_01305, partial [Bacteroidota bacterium]
TATGLMSLHIGSLLHFSPWFFAINIAILAMVLFVYLRFFFRPIKENNILTNTALVTTTAYFTNLLVNTVLTYAW